MPRDGAHDARGRDDGDRGDVHGAEPEGDERGFEPPGRGQIPERAGGQARAPAHDGDADSGIRGPQQSARIVEHLLGRKVRVGTRLQRTTRLEADAPHERDEPVRGVRDRADGVARFLAEGPRLLPVRVREERLEELLLVAVPLAVDEEPVDERGQDGHRKEVEDEPRPERAAGAPRPPGLVRRLLAGGTIARVLGPRSSAAHRGQVNATRSEGLRSGPDGSPSAPDRSRT